MSKKKETIKKGGTMGFIEFPRPLVNNNEVVYVGTDYFDYMKDEE